MNLDNNQSNQSTDSEYRTACGGRLKDPSKYPEAEYKGKTVYFCTQACLEVFLQDPDPFMAGEVEHPA
ncbi:MAG: YHS domain-containing protein [Anaerolineales bacterium]